MEDYSLIKKLEIQNEINLNGATGFAVTSSEDYNMILKDVEYVDKDCINQFVFLKNQIKKAPKTGIKISRKRSGCNPDTQEYKEKKLLIKRYVENNLRIKVAYDDTGYRFKENLIGLFFDYDYRLLLPFYNSSLISFFLYFTTAQIGKGTWNMLHKNEVESIPIPLESNIPSKHKRKLITLTERILEAGKASPELINQIDEIIFNIYHLKEYEKQRIRDFFNVHNRKNISVASGDLQKYVNRFRDVFRFILKDDKYLNAEGYVSSTIGAGILFCLTDISEGKPIIEFNEVPDIKKLIQIVTKKQIGYSQRNSLLKQEKVKIYNKQKFAIIKSNQFKDWTETEAIKDAKEEVELFIKSLPDN